MKKILLLCLVFIVTFLNAQDIIFVVERENSALAVIKHHLLVDTIKHMHNFNHAYVLFKGKDGYVITRDGYIIKFSPITDKIEKEYRTSPSAIDFLVEKNFVAVANYGNKTINIISRNLKPIQSIKTNSRNVGIQMYKNYLIFECMDTNEIWVLKDTQPKAKEPHFIIYKKFKHVGLVPFDALIDKNIYVAGLFDSPFIGVLNLKTMKYKTIPLKFGKRDRVLKVPHFGVWGVSKKFFVIPAVGAKKVFVFNHKFKLIKAISVVGNPVFTALSPNRKLLACTFSGKEFPRVQIINMKTFKIIKNFKFKGKVLHVRWSTNGKYLYVSVNGANEVLGINTHGWWKKFAWPVPRSSGIFIYKTKNSHAKNF